MQTKNAKKQLIRMAAAVLLVLGLNGCGGGGGGAGSADTGGATPAGTAVIGTVPGTLIEAFCDNGAYYSTNSTDNGTAKHPFRLELPPDLGYRLVMTTNGGTAEEVVSPIGFLDSDNVLHTRLILTDHTVIDLGYVPLPMSRAEAANNDANGDGILDAPFILDNYQAQGAMNPLRQLDADHDAVMDWQDTDHGGQQYAGNTVDPQDVDGDGVPNGYDEDFTPAQDDSDADGLPDHLDANPTNNPDDNGDFEDDLDGDGYHDGDHDRDGFPDGEQSGPGDADRGAILFGTHCAGCHGADAGDILSNTAEAISSAVNSNGAMALVAAQLTAQDYALLAAYVNLAGHEAGWNDEENHGAYAENNGVAVCAACHGGVQLTGNGAIPSCYRCHEDEWGGGYGGTTPLPTGNTVPVARAGSDQNVNTGDAVTLDGSASFDADNDIITYRWTLAGTPAGSAAILSDPNIAGPGFTADVAGTYTLNLVVNDGLADSISDTMTVTATDVPMTNVAPVADAGTNRNVNEGDTVGLDGSGSRDANNDPLTYNWTMTVSPNGSAATLSDAAAVAPTFTADLAGIYTVQLVVNDGTVDSNAATVTITAVAAPPAIDGAALYSSRCFGCHRSMGNRSAAQITAAINANRGGMSFLSSLTAAEIEAIALFLGP